MLRTRWLPGISVWRTWTCWVCLWFLWLFVQYHALERKLKKGVNSLFLNYAFAKAWVWKLLKFMMTIGVILMNIMITFKQCVEIRIQLWIRNSPMNFICQFNDQYSFQTQNGIYFFNKSNCLILIDQRTAKINF